MSTIPRFDASLRPWSVTGLLARVRDWFWRLPETWLPAPRISQLPRTVLMFIRGTKRPAPRCRMLSDQARLDLIHELDLGRRRMVRWLVLSAARGIRRLPTGWPLVLVLLTLVIAALPIEPLEGWWPDGKALVDPDAFLSTLWQVMAGTLGIGVAAILFLYETYSSSANTRSGISAADYSAASGTVRMIVWITASLVLIGAVLMGWGGMTFGWAGLFALIVSGYALYNVLHSFKELAAVAHNELAFQRLRLAVMTERVAVAVREIMLTEQMEESFVRELAAANLVLVETLPPPKAPLVLGRSGIVTDIRLPRLRRIAHHVQNGQLRLWLLRPIMAGAPIAGLTSDSDHKLKPFVVTHAVNESTVNFKRYLQDLHDSSLDAISEHDKNQLDWNLEVYALLIERLLAVERALSALSRTRPLTEKIYRDLRKHLMQQFNTAFSTDIDAAEAVLMSQLQISQQLAAAGNLYAAIAFLKNAAAMVLMDVRSDAYGRMRKKLLQGITSHLAAASEYSALSSAQKSELLAASLTELMKVVVVAEQERDKESEQLWSRWDAARQETAWARTQFDPVVAARGFKRRTEQPTIYMVCHAILLAVLLRHACRIDLVEDAATQTHYRRLFSKIGRLYKHIEFAPTIKCLLDSRVNRRMFLSVWRELQQRTDPSETLQEGMTRLIVCAMLRSGSVNEELSVLGTWTRQLEDKEVSDLATEMATLLKSVKERLNMPPAVVVQIFAGVRKPAQHDYDQDLADTPISPELDRQLTVLYRAALVSEARASTMVTAAGAQAVHDRPYAENKQDFHREILLSGNEGQLTAVARGLATRVADTEELKVTTNWRSNSEEFSGSLPQALSMMFDSKQVAVVHAVGYEEHVKDLPRFPGRVVHPVATDQVEPDEILVVDASPQVWHFGEASEDPPLTVRGLGYDKDGKPPLVQILFGTAPAVVQGDPAKVLKVTVRREY